MGRRTTDDTAEIVQPGGKVGQANSRWRASSSTAGRRVREVGEVGLVGEGERLGVDAVAQPGRRGAVLEDVPQVAIAAGAQDLRPLHAVAVVVLGDDVLLRD